MAGQVAKGAWSAEEDDKLSMAVHEHGQKYVEMALPIADHADDVVSDGRSLPSASPPGTAAVRRLSHLVHSHSHLYLIECAKRWTDALDPAINRQEWTDEEVRVA
jgi:hypothetical protein